MYNDPEAIFDSTDTLKCSVREKQTQRKVSLTNVQQGAGERKVSFTISWQCPARGEETQKVPLTSSRLEKESQEKYL